MQFIHEDLEPADDAYHIDKRAFEVPFVCGATNIGEALRCIGEGAAMIRTKGEAGTGNVVEAVRHARRNHAWSRHASAIVKAVEHYDETDALAEVSRNLGEAMVGIGMEDLAENQLLARRG